MLNFFHRTNKLFHLNVREEHKACWKNKTIRLVWLYPYRSNTSSPYGKGHCFQHLLQKDMALRFEGLSPVGGLLNIPTTVTK